MGYISVIMLHGIVIHPARKTLLLPRCLKWSKQPWCELFYAETHVKKQGSCWRSTNKKQALNPIGHKEADSANYLISLEDSSPVKPWDKIAAPVNTLIAPCETWRETWS